ncbi:MAG: lysylphosphatidylglycerol synthase transmembrane domain-containing protein [Thermodesulfobacteriota bacterium]
MAIFFFMGKMVWDNWAQVKEVPFSVNSLGLFWATLVFVLSYFIQIGVWYLLTVKLGIHLSPSETLTAWFYSQMGKYLPGKVWLIVGRFYFYTSRGKSKKAISLALYFETMTLLIAGGLLFVISLFFFKEMGQLYSARSWGWVLFLFLLVLLSLHPKMLQKILNWILLRLNQEPISLSISYSDILWVLGLSILSWVIGGVGFYLFVDSILPSSFGNFLFLTGALAISHILGLFAIIVPGGLGVREGVLVYLLSWIMPNSVAVILSVLTRLWMTLIEIGLIGVIYFLHQFYKE